MGKMFVANLIGPCYQARVIGTEEPADGDYEINPVGDNPTCTIGSPHVLRAVVTP